MALAGYDPRVVVEVLEDGVGIVLSGWPLFDDYLYTHPTRKKRVQLLSQPKVMEEALSLYREVLAQRGSREVSMQRGRDANKSNSFGSVHDLYASCGIRIRKF